MARPFKYRWHAASQAWRSDCGDLYFDKKGRQRRKTVTLRYPGGEKIPKADKAAALAALARRLEALKPQATGYTCGQLADLFLYALDQRVKADLASELTYRSYVKLLSAAVARWGTDTPAADIKAKDLESLVARWQEAGKSVNYCNLLITAATACFSWASRPIAERGKDSAGRDLPEQLLPATPFARFPRLPTPHGKNKYADRAEVAGFLRWLWNLYHPERNAGPYSVGAITGMGHCPPRKNGAQVRWDRQLILLIRFILWTGCRPSEACKARWEWVDWEARTLTLPPNRHKTGRKTGKERRIYIPPVLLRALRRTYDSPIRHPECLFSHRRVPALKGEEHGVPWNSEALGSRIRRLRSQAVEEGVRIRSKGDNRWHLYRLRHTRASDGLMRGYSEAEVAAALGTSGELIRKTYGHILDEHTAATAAGMLGKPRSARKP